MLPQYLQAVEQPVIYGPRESEELPQKTEKNKQWQKRLTMMYQSKHFFSQ